MKYLDKVNAKNLYLLFVKHDQQSELWEKWAKQLDKHGDEKKIKEHWSDANSYLCEYYIKNFVNCLFSNDFFHKDVKHYADILKIYSVLNNDDAYDENTINLWYKGKEIKISKLSYCAPELVAILPEILSASARNGHCHELSHGIVDALQNKACIMTGKVYGMSDKTSYFHSWVEFEDNDGSELVVDGTLNAIYLREDYYDLMHAEPLCAVTSEQIAHDEPWLKQLGEMGYKQYLIFRNELAREFDKKPHEFWEGEQ